MDCYVTELQTEGLGATVGDALLAVHRSYLNDLRAIWSDCGRPAVHGLAHITGGGFYDNVPRVMPDGVTAVIDPTAWKPLPVFDLAGELLYRARKEDRLLLVHTGDGTFDTLFNAALLLLTRHVGQWSDRQWEVVEAYRRLGRQSRVATELLMGQRSPEIPREWLLPPGQLSTLLVLPLPVRGLDPLLNGRNLQLRLQSDGPVSLATLAAFGNGDQPPPASRWARSRATASTVWGRRTTNSSPP